jgi:hypothetical protein
MSWTDEYITVWCPECGGTGVLPSVSGDGSYTGCKTCKGYRMVRIPENKLVIYDPEDDDED